MNINYSDLIEKLIKDVLEIKKSDLVSIRCMALNKSEDNPLLQIEFVEEFVFSLSKLKAFSLIDLNTENIQERIYEEFTEEESEILDNYCPEGTNKIDVLIDFSWRNLPDLQGDFLEKQSKYLLLADKSLQNVFENKIRKNMILGFPTKRLAQFLNINVEQLEDHYFKSLNCNYLLLPKVSDVIVEFFNNNEKLIIETKEMAFEFKINKSQNVEIFDGKTNLKRKIPFPAGRIMTEIDRQSCNGDILFDYIIYDNIVFDDIVISIKDGAVTSVSGDDENEKLRNFLINLEPDIYLNLGFNDKITRYIKYAQIDRVKDGGISFIFENEQISCEGFIKNARLNGENMYKFINEVRNG